MTGRLHRLHSEQGQSPWLDNLQRGFLLSGGLSRMIGDGIRGLTSNPSIFQKAIETGSEYEDEFATAISGGLDPEQAYWQLVTTDIRAAADLFAGLHAASGGVDGHVSVEVDPRLAHDAQATLRAARELHTRVDRPNVMIKIPATLEGIPVVRQLTAEGINVNVTLIFGLDRHRRVMDAYLQGLEDRLDGGLPVDRIASVASFFVSRVDSEVDRRLGDTGTAGASALRGTAAVAQARLAYRNFRETFSGPRWQRLSAAGARVQRPLWASTSTKNPAYPDTLYVDSLIGPDTVNTLPDATVAAFADHGTVARAVDSDPAGTDMAWSALAAAGVDMEDVAQVLEQEGIASFISSFDQLLAVLRGKAPGVRGA